MHLIDVANAPKNEHRFFVDDQDEGKSFDPVKKFNTHESLINRKSNRLTLEQLENLKVPEWMDDTYLKVRIRFNRLAFFIMYLLVVPESPSKRAE